MAVPSMIPAFFKLFDPDSCSQTLRIPSTFTSSMNGKLPDKTAFLGDRFSNVWPVEVIRKREKTYFTKGWGGFVEDNGIETEDILLFQFNGYDYFDVKHFDKDGCEKWARKSNVSSTSKNRSKGKAAVKDEVGSEDDVNEADGGCVDVFESGLIARPRNPFFIVHLKLNKRNELPIPPQLIKDHNLEIPGEIIIVGEDRKEFHSMISTWGDGRKIVTNGWRAFRKWNFVTVEDTCLCEFVSSHRLLIRVLRFRAGKWMPRPITQNPPEVVADTNMMIVRFNDCV